MTYAAKIISDSISREGVRITTMQLTYPRYIHAEFMTHRVFSRNASSSRAIPTAKLVENSLRDMVLPIKWGLNQAGMQAQDEELSADDQEEAENIWRWMAEQCAYGVSELAKLGPINPETKRPVGLHKQWANRPLEWFGTITVVVTATDWDNFFQLRDHPMAQPEIHYLAKLMVQAQSDSTPVLLYEGEWHLPYVLQEEKDTLFLDELLKISTARCARVSYLTQEGTTPSIQKDLELYDRLVGSVPLHASPCEHQATPNSISTEYSGNFRGWIQHRKQLEASLAI